MTPSPHRTSDTNGFTLVEIVIALAILALGVTSAVGLMRWVVKGTDFNMKYATATFLAQDKIEEMVAATYTNVMSGSDSTQNMDRVWTVATVGNYKTLNVTVSWTGLDGMARTAVMNSILSH